MMFFALILALVAAFAQGCSQDPNFDNEILVQSPAVQILYKIDDASQTIRFRATLLSGAGVCV